MNSRNCSLSWTTMIESRGDNALRIHTPGAATTPVFIIVKHEVEHRKPDRIVPAHHKHSAGSCRDGRLDSRFRTSRLRYL